MEMPQTQLILESDASESSLTALETGVIDLFVNGVRVLGLPKSIGEIYGLLYISPEPLSFDEILSRLQISKGSTSQGLKILRSLGAVRAVYVAGARRDYFVAETELKKLVGGFIREELSPHLESGTERLESIQSHLPDASEPDAQFFKDRVGKLGTWHKRTELLLPIIRKFLT
jgi:HTH-type transcriptional regulator, glycine betaine synthesis regulator